MHGPLNIRFKEVGILYLDQTMPDIKFVNFILMVPCIVTLY